jgi:type VI secretion system protein ImpF
MAELTPQERLQPSLLDRLADDEPGQKTESREKRVLTLQQLRDCVIRDLDFLLNTGCLQTTEDLDAYPLVAGSVLNYGVRGLAGSHTTSADEAAIERNLRKAIMDFEPRILRDSLSVRVVVQKDGVSRSTMQLEIEGELWAQPLPLHLLLRTDVDLEKGSIAIKESTAMDPR